jgi:hypothetical protein
LQESQARKEAEDQLIQMIEDKFKRILTNEVSKESRIRYEQVEQLKSCLENDFPKVQDILKQEKEQREQSDLIVREKAEEQVGQIEIALEQEKNAREETEEAILEMLKEMVGKIKGEIDHERMEREQNHETLIQLLEDTCNKFNTTTTIQIDNQ